MTPDEAFSPAEDEEEDAAIACDVCGALLSEEPARGWVSWWAKNGVVSHFAVACEGACVEKLRERFDAADLDLFDHHLNVFLGRRALPRLAQLVAIYTWEPATRDRMLAFFLKAGDARETEASPTGRAPARRVR